MPTSIIALGGGGFSMEPANPLLDRYCLAQARGPRPRVCFLATASGDADGYLLKFYAAFARHDCRASHLSLVAPHTADLRGFLLEQDLVYVGGGNTRNLLTLWREWGLDAALREAARGGTVLCGLSAGSICWFEAGLSDSVVPGTLAPIRALGFIAGSHCPHYDGEPQRRPAYQAHVADGRLPPGWSADDGAALHVVDGKLAACVASRPTARCWRVERGPAGAVESELTTRYLGGQP